ncbi:MAG TPA: Veg protein [Clostridiaceae bacterium]|nr:Veg protein [Clostridiaceae bacterium]
MVKADIDQCRRDLEACLGRKVRLRTSGGRKRVIIREGILENCYPNVFTVRCIRDNENTELLSYSYVDILTEAVEVAVEPDPELAVLADRSLQDGDDTAATTADVE